MRYFPFNVDIWKTVYISQSINISVKIPMVEIHKIVIHQEKSSQFDMTFNGFILKFASSYSMNAFTGLNP